MTRVVGKVPDFPDMDEELQSVETSSEQGVEYPLQVVVELGKHMVQHITEFPETVRDLLRWSIPSASREEREGGSRGSPPILGSIFWLRVAGDS